jgi:hypothetical protein
MSGCENGDSSDDGGGPIAVGAQAPLGSPLDAGSEVPGPATVKAFWGSAAPRMGVMCQGNSFKLIEGDRQDAYIPEIVAEAGAFKISANADGSLTAICKDFVSSRSGLVWKFQGYTVGSENNSIVTDNPLVIQPDDFAGTLRGYWNSYLRAK